MNMHMTLTKSTDDWWAGGAFVGSDWRSRLEFNAAQAHALVASDAWWLRNRLSYQFAELERELGLTRRWLAPMVVLR